MTETLDEQQQASDHAEASAEIALARLPELSLVESTFGLPGDSVHQNGLVLAGRTAEFDDWTQMGHSVARFNRWSRFALGDWLNWGAEMWPDGDLWAQAVEATPDERYAVASRVTGLKVETLRDYARVCERVPVGIRRTELGFSDHKPVAGLDPADQVIWLERMIQNGWDASQLKEEITAATRGPASEDDDGAVVVLDPPSSTADRAFEVLQLVASQGQPTSDGGLLVPAEVAAQVRALVGEE